MRKWKKVMAAALAVSMMAPSCLPQTLWAAEFSSESAEEASEGFAEKIADNMEENENTADDAVTEPDEIVKDETEDSGPAEDQDFGSDDEELTNDSDAADSADAEEVTEENNELDLSDVPEMVMEGEAVQDYLIQLYSSGKLVKSYTVSNSASAAAKAPAALKKSGYTFKEWNTKADGKGTAYKPGASISKLLQESSTAVQPQNVESADSSVNLADSADEAEAELESVQDVQAPEVQSEVQDIAEAQDTAQELLAEEDSAQPVELEQQSDAGLEVNPAAEASAEDDKITVRLYAIWTKNASYKITYKLNGGKNHASNPKTYTIESQIKLKNPTRSGYHFVGWYKDSKYKTKISTIKKGSKGSLTLYARWTPQVSPSSKAAALTSVKGLRAKTIVATATVPKYVRSYDSYYYLVYVNSNTGKVKRAAAKITKPQTSNRKITLKVNISKNPEYAQGKFAIAVKKTKTAWALISGKSYVSSPEKLASKGSWEERVNRASVCKIDGKWLMWYTGQSRNNSAIGIATSDDGIRFTRMQQKPILVPSEPYEKGSVMNPCVLWDKDEKIFKMWYAAGEQFEPDVLCYAESKDGINWERYANNPILEKSNEKYDQCKVGGCDILKENDRYYMFYIGYQNVDTARVCMAESNDGIHNWVRSMDNPVISPEKKSWDADAVYKPTVVLNKQKNKLLMWYNGRKQNCERIGLAEYRIK